MYLYNNPQVDSIINLALSEDIGTGDITTISTIPADKTAHARESSPPSVPVRPD